MSETEIFQIDLEKVFKNKIPKTAKRLPGFIFHLLEKIICQDELNRVLRTYHDLDGIDFMEAMVNDYNIHLTIQGKENIRKDGRYVFASNHPLGGMDGVCLTAVLGRMFDYKVRCLVNDVLLYVPALRAPFVAVNKYGAQSRDAAQKINEVFASENQIITFPAGLVSRRYNGIVQDSEWKKAFITKARETKRDIVPVFFDGVNSNFFYNFSVIRKALKIKFNIELFFLPREMVKSKNKTFNIYIGKPVSWQSFDISKNDAEWASWIRELSYNLPKQELI
ncbi:MAG: 1-acyl-sn-glycerol-3-phosphate acyltransferase [Bacteroidales bacterium]|nr:1-acyl-sn-glycerol-3-phosphate acyltransferase [Bacteroidales bacterium]